MTDDTHYAEIIVRSSFPTDWERKFCASIIAQKRRRQVLSAKQHATMSRIAGRFKDANLRDEVIE
jgi:hypothetical protein